ncbi:hypothetical protein [Pseudoalteromonas sp. Ps84H-4]|uniref:hypothetical protein n=1 Tax=Pseudoalteromonas sp. Ps84H-4 TaxID=2954502 RepID=UPI002096A10F|nr:hypothetical protein [Pseudoalteromonas sp. Ps84H-4]MCO7250510.1 hypothetical protein [Pseudoalteromonas sp. Ps84H-4]
MSSQFSASSIFAPHCYALMFQRSLDPVWTFDANNMEKKKMFCEHINHEQLNCFQPSSKSENDLLNEVMKSEDLHDILTMVLLDETLSDAFKAMVRKQLKIIKNMKRK